MYGDSNVIASNKERKNLNVTKQPCHARDKQRTPLPQTRQKTVADLGEGQEQEVQRLLQS